MTLSKEKAKSAIEALMRHPTAYFGEAESREVAGWLSELLALRERAEPVAWMKRSIREAENWDSVDPEFVKSPEGWMSDYLPLYAAPPAPVVPVVPDELPEFAPADVIKKYFNWTDDGDAEVFSMGWNACRDAMLKGTEDATS